MMRFLLIVFLPLSCFAQGFGSFVYDQPYLAQEFGAGTWDLSLLPGMEHWWHAGDLTNGAVTYWDDRISGSRATNNGTVALPTKDTNGVHFAMDTYLGKSGAYLLATDTVRTSDNYAIIAIARPYCLPEARYQIFGTFVNEFGIGWTTVTPANGQRLKNSANTYASSAYDASGWQNVVCLNTNDVGGSGTIHYTNGVYSATLSAFTYQLVDKIGPTTQNQGMSIQEIIVMTNILDMSPYVGLINAFMATNFPTHYTTDVPFVIGQTLGTTNNNYSGEIGYYFIPTMPMVVTELGRWDNPWSSHSHTIKLVRKSDLSLLGSVSVTCDGANDWKWTALGSPITLVGNTEYILKSTETSGGDTWCARETTYMTNYYTDGVIQGYCIETTTGFTPQQGWGPLNMRYH